MKKVLMLILIIVGCFVSETKAQKVALKSNLLYDATATMNLGLEFGLARKWTLDIPVNYHPWKPADGKRLRHWGRTGRLSVKISRITVIRDIYMVVVFLLDIRGY